MDIMTDLKRAIDNFPTSVTTTETEDYKRGYKAGYAQGYNEGHKDAYRQQAGKYERGVDND